MNQLLLFSGIIVLAFIEGNAAVEPRTTKFSLNKLNGYFELLPHDPNGKYNGPIELSCNILPVIGQLARKAVLLNSAGGDLTFVRVTDSIVAIYTLPPAYDYDRIPTIRIALDGITFNETCDYTRATGVGRMRIECDLVSLASYISRQVTFSYPSVFNRPSTNVSVSRIGVTQVNFRVAALPEIEHSNAKICCVLPKNVIDSVSVEALFYPNNCQIPYVGYEPFKPTIFETDVTILDCNTLTFSWSLSRKNKTYTTTYTSYYMPLNNSQYMAYIMEQTSGTVRLERSYVACSTCKVEVNDTELKRCSVNLDTYVMAYLLKVVGVNEVGTTSSDEFLLDTIKHVTPSAVRELRVVTVSNTHVELKWSHHVVSCPMPVEFVVNITCVDRTDICEHVPHAAMFQSRVLMYNQPTLGQVVQHSITSLHPHTQYRVDIVTRLVGADMPSDVKVTDLRTLPALPAVAPQVCPECFSVVRSNGVLHSVAVYWKQIPRHEQNNDIIGYRLQVVGDRGQMSVVDTPDGGTTSAVIDSSVISSTDNSNTIVAIAAAVNLGSDDDKKLGPDAVVEIPSAALLQESVTAGTLSTTLISYNSTAVEVIWAGVEGAVAYTLAYCRRAEKELCEGDISWRHVTAPGPVLLSISNLDLHDIMIGVSVDLGRYVTGIVWSDCPKFDSNQPAKAPSFIFHKKTSSSLTLVVEVEKCVVNMREYEIVYCEGEQHDSCEGDDGSRKVKVEMLKRLTSEVTLTDLRPSQMYTVLVRAHTPPGQVIGRQLQPVVKHEETLAADYHTMIIVVTLLVLGVVSVGIIAICKRPRLVKMYRRLVVPIRISNIRPSTVTKYHVPHDSYDSQGRELLSNSSSQQTGEDDLHLFANGGSARNHATRLSSSEQPLLDAEEQQTAAADKTLRFGKSGAVIASNKARISQPIPVYSTTRVVNSGVSSVSGPIAAYSTTAFVEENSGSSNANADGMPAYSATALIGEDNSGTSSIVSWSGSVPADLTLAFVGGQPATVRAALPTIVGSNNRLLSIPDYSTTAQVGAESGGASTASVSNAMPACSRTTVVGNTSNSGTSSVGSFLPTYSTTAYYDKDEEQDADNDLPNIETAEKSGSRIKDASGMRDPDDGYSYAAQDPVYDENSATNEVPADDDEHDNNDDLIANGISSNGNSTTSVGDLAQHSNIRSDSERSGQSSYRPTHDDGYSTAIVPELPSNSGGSVHSSVGGKNHSGASNFSATSGYAITMALNSGNNVSYSDYTNTADSDDDISVAKNESGAIADTDDGYSRTIGLTPSV